MGRMSVNAGGGGADLDAITAGAEDIVSPKVGLDNEGEPLAGTLKDNSGVTKSAAASLDATNSRVQLTVPETGKYSLTSKLYATYATIRSLIGLTADKLWTGVTILGLKSSRNALAAKTWTPGTANQTIAAGTCVTGAQTIKGDSNLKAANIKKGVSIFGITGTWEGYVATPTDLYNNGLIGGTAGGLTDERHMTIGSTIVRESNSILVEKTTTSTAISSNQFTGLRTNNLVNLTPYSKIIMEGRMSTISGGQAYPTIFIDGATGMGSDVRQVEKYDSSAVSGVGNFSVTLAISEFQASRYVYFGLRVQSKGVGARWYIYRCYLA